MFVLQLLAQFGLKCQSLDSHALSVFQNASHAAVTLVVRHLRRRYQVEVAAKLYSGDLTFDSITGSSTLVGEGMSTRAFTFSGSGLMPVALAGPTSTAS